MCLRRLIVSLWVLVAAIANAQSLESLPTLGNGHNFRFSSSSIDPRANVDFRPILPGKTFTLADIKGPGTIRRMWMTILPSEPGYSRLMTLRIYWNGEKQPSVECPLGDFFGVGHGMDAPVNSLPVRCGADGRARTCFWPMPFERSARITLTNEGSRATWCFYYQVDGQYEPVKPGTPTFHAEYRQQFPCRPGDYVAADIRGRGRYVGTVVSVRSTSDGWWGEGNDYFYVDGEKQPSLKGTGFEDYFGEAWGLRKTDGPYSGCSVFEGGFIGARASAYRWHIPDPIEFRSSLKVEFQHMGVGQNAKGEWVNNIERPDEFSSVAFWYQTGEHAPYPPLPSGYDRLPFDYRGFIDAETAPYSIDSGVTDVVHLNGTLSDRILEWHGAKKGGELSVGFQVERAGQYQVMVLIARQDKGALGQFLIDGRPCGDPVSFYEDGDDVDIEAPLEVRALSAGKHTLTLRCQGSAPGAKPGSWFAIDGFVVQALRK